ncbi:HAD hydrolase-like protein [bacterium]|nr:HAD hydrolase-like protein [bacterium]
MDTTSFPAYPPAEFLPGTHIEVRSPDLVRGRLRFALFDFDGTISLIREGWQQVMIPMMVELLQQTGTDESAEQLEAIVSEFVTRLTGKQTIYQMIALADEIKLRGLEPEEPLVYKNMYLDLLWERICHRVEGLQRGEIDPEAMLVPGARHMLQRLADAGITMYLASGTDHRFVVSEAQALKVDHFFGEYIYGAQDNYQNFSKKMVIDRIIAENSLHGPEFCAFGDGFVEVEDAKDSGGLAVGVATNEETREGINEWKRNRLIQAGADLIIGDFAEADKLLDYLGV